MKLSATYGAKYPTASVEFVYNITDFCADTSKTSISVPDSVITTYVVADPQISLKI